MLKYIGFRIFQALLGLWFIATLVFILSRSIGDPAEVFTARNSGVDAREIMAAKLGLDRPVHEQYLKFLGQLVRLDLGDSVSNGIPVTQILVERMPATFTLGLVALIFALALSLPLGVLGAVYRDSAIDWIAKVLAFLGQSMPPFWSGIMLIILFAVVWEMLPPAGKGGWQSYILPGFTLGWGVMAGMVRLVRSSMMDVLDSDYVAMARAKGLPEAVVIGKHALRNALLPVLTYSSLVLGAFMNGSVVVEQVFAWPGIGTSAVQSVVRRDFPVIQGVVIVFGSFFILINLFVDILYAVIDPRIKYTP
ncbi:MAG: ABC transporter permease [Chloroflexota bacterium]|nr:ABC transporter permease [Chloroflexota bacterium]